MFRGVAGLDLAALGIPTEREYVRRYCERTGRPDADAVQVAGFSCGGTHVRSPRSRRER